MALFGVKRFKIIARKVSVDRDLAMIIATTLHNLRSSYSILLVRNTNPSRIYLEGLVCKKSGESLIIVLIFP